jgi:hypothetical protein
MLSCSNCQMSLTSAALQYSCLQGPMQGSMSSPTPDSSITGHELKAAGIHGFGVDTKCSVHLWAVLPCGFSNPFL